MKKLTKKTKKNIYLKAYLKFSDPYFTYGICSAINKTSNLNIYTDYSNNLVFSRDIKLLPELDLFNYKANKMDYLPCDRDVRELILLFCIEMCN